jgi:hypothetical protein
MPSSGGYFSVWRDFRYRWRSSSGNCFPSGDIFRWWNLLQVENIPGLILSRRPVSVEELLPLRWRTPVEASSLSGGFPLTVSGPVEFRGNRGIASFQTRRFLWTVNRLRNSDSGNRLSQLSDTIGIAPFRIVRSITTVLPSEGSPSRGIVRGGNLRRTNLRPLQRHPRLDRLFCRRSPSGESIFRESQTDHGIASGPGRRLRQGITLPKASLVMVSHFPRDLPSENCFASGLSRDNEACLRRCCDGEIGFVNRVPVGSLLRGSG